MNTVELLHAPAPLQHQLQAWGQALRVQLDPPAAADAAAPVTVWLGGGYSELLSHVGALPRHQTLVADADPRRLRRAAAAAGESARTLRLLRLSDLRRDAAGVEAVIAGVSLRELDLYLALEERLQQRFAQAPALADHSVDHLLMDLVVNRVGEEEEPLLLAEALRVLRRGGRLSCLALVSDEPLPGRHAVRGAPAGPALRLPTETGLLRALEAAGFHGLTWQACTGLAPVDRVGEADVRLVLVEAYKGKQGPCFELGQAVIYRGPWREVRDDDGHVYPRGARVAVCAKTFDLLMGAPYEGMFIGVRSVQEPPLQEASPFDCNTPALRDPRVSKGLAPFAGARVPSSACAPGSGCC